MTEMIKKLAGKLRTAGAMLENVPGVQTYEDYAKFLIDEGVTVQTTPISYERLLALAKAMHTWIFCNTGDEQKVYDEIGLTDDENYVFGYGGKIEISIPEPPKGE